MRFLARTLLLALFLAGGSTPCRAEFRHISSRFFDDTGSAFIKDGDAAGRPVKPVAVNTHGDVFMCAQVGNTVSFGTNPVGPGAVGTEFSSSGVHVWSRVLYQTAQSTNVTIYSVALADDGSVAIAGTLAGTVNFGGGSITSTDNYFDAFVVKLDATGNVAWQHVYGGKYEETAHGVAFASDGDVFVVGSFRSNVDFGGGFIPNLGANDVFVVKLNGATGSHIWSRGYGQAGAQDGLEIVAGADDSITLMCSLGMGGIDFGGGLLVRGGGNIVLANLSGDGTHIWSRTVGGTQGATPGDLAVNRNGDTFISGYFASAMDPGNGTLLIARPTARRTAFFASYRTGGNYRWSYALFDSLDSRGAGVGATRDGKCVGIATAHGEFLAPGGSVPPAGFLFMEFDSLGNCGTARGFGDPASFNRVFVGTADDDVFLAGSSDGPVDFGGGELQPALQSNVYLAHLALRRPPQLSIGGLTARLLDDIDVELHWNLTSHEPLAGYYLTRQSNGSPDARVLKSGAAVDGDATLIDHDALPGHRYTYEITVETALGDLVSSSTVIDVPAAKTSLAQNTPNPFNPLTTFTYSLAQPAHVSIAIYDLSGALVCKIDQGAQPAGRHEAQWAGHNWSGNLVASGVYFYRLEGAGNVPARKMILLK
jgi:hypothetical protein